MRSATLYALLISAFPVSKKYWDIGGNQKKKKEEGEEEEENKRHKFMEE